MMYLIQILYFLATCLLAGKDADSYLLKSKTDSNLTSGRIIRWHRDGFLLAALYAAFCVMLMPNQWYFVLGMCICIRLSFFDFLFNDWSGLNVSYLGGTSWVDTIFVKIFGVNGAIRKSLLFFFVLIVLNVIKLIWQ